MILFLLGKSRLFRFNGKHLFWRLKKKRLKCGHFQ